MLTEGARVVERAPGRLIIEIDSSRGPSYFEIATVNPRNYIRNIRILLPGCDGDENFNPAWIEKIRPFKILRAMCWILGDNPEQVSRPHWNDRPKVTARPRCGTTPAARARSGASSRRTSATIEA